ASRGVEKLTKAIQGTTSLDELKGKFEVEKLLNLVNNSNKVICDGSSRIAEIVRSLKNFSRIDEAENQEADVHEGLDSTLTLVHHQFKNRIEVIREYGNLPLINCYPNQLNQVFMNLLVNASQAVEDKGTVKIHTSSDGTNVQIKIIDSGKGIPAENLDKIFDPGYTTKGVGIGTGLGLSICYNIIKKHQGNISASSKVGEGTVFTITLPIAPPA
ncbi:sensor histidine kinase, partial [Fibrobacterota bacterium]